MDRKIEINPYLIQRIEKKSKDLIKRSFGARGERGYLSKEIDSELRKKSIFAYMGSAEFETNALPEALFIMATLHKKGSLLNIVEVFLNGLTVYVLSNLMISKEAIKAVENLRKKDISRETIYFNDLKDNKDIVGNTVGWIDVGSIPYMFFIDKKMATFYFNFLKRFKGDFSDRIVSNGRCLDQKPEKEIDEYFKRRFSI